ncbi:MAG: response regulator transcription factor [Burkholderiales bacterium]|nr:MAG: response regulator transcription factor [Burkholderiales bacterium]
MSITSASDGARVVLAGPAPLTAASLLREAGCQVLSASSPAMLLRLAGDAPRPRLILLGETVGDQPGLSLLARMQDDALTRSIPVLYVAQESDEELALALGAADCLTWPLRPLVLLARVQAQLRLASLAGLSGVLP